MDRLKPSSNRRAHSSFGARIRDDLYVSLTKEISELLGVTSEKTENTCAYIQKANQEQLQCPWTCQQDAL
jgi:hypothetical protein